ncbi:hypothetical protein AAP_03130 [Ascosphaera apis ARSEF 7405]|uniref:DUF7707 domain-containing protein n=1 Tax=Ascosphaera apis ARSEF 7405 TaxID=392613 RepID=A0A167YYA5_9EURO|nr:hypothetical protein AAP_03130 [Ascosphaera apis ARSEF 7405]
MDDDLSFSCICNNDQTPNATEYSQTIPYFICTQQNNDCVNACPNNNADCQYNCRAQNPCGAKSPKRYNITTTTTATTASATGDVTGTSATPSQTVYSGMAGEEDSSPSNGAIGLTPVYGYGVLLSAFIGGFAVFL